MPRPFATVFLVLAVGVAALWVAAPYLVPAGSERGLDGAANVMDHRERWDALPPVPGFAYRLGDLVCHQMDARSLHANGNQFPVDARLLPMAVASVPGFAWALRAPAAPASEAVAALVPVGWPAPLRRRLATWVLLVALAPTAIDGLLERVTSYVSSIPMRVATGSLLGFAGALWLAVSFDALARPDLPSAQREGEARGK